MPYLELFLNFCVLNKHLNRKLKLLWCGPDKERILKITFIRFVPTRTYFVGTQWSYLAEAIPIAPTIMFWCKTKKKKILDYCQLSPHLELCNAM